MSNVHEGVVGTGGGPSASLTIHYSAGHGLWYVQGDREKVGIGRSLEAALVQLAAKLMLDGYEDAPLKELAPRLLPLMGVGVT